MKAKLLLLWETLQSSYWFIPLLLQLGALLLSYGVLLLDQRGLPSWWPGYFGSFVTDHESSRAMLSTIAGSMITTASVTFSITMVALSLTSQQFGPRLLRGFMRDRVNQFVLGSFLATYSFCILVLRTISESGDLAPPFIPRISIVVALTLAISNVFVLIAFIHHVSISINADSVIASATAELESSVSGMFGSADSSRPVEDPKVELAALERWKSASFASRRTGYVQLVDYPGLTKFADKHDLTVFAAERAGRYAIRNAPLGRIWPAQTDSSLVREAAEYFIINDSTTAAQDLEHVLRQLVEVAIRALSPGINDAFTAITCVDRLTSSLCLISEQPPLQRVFRGQNGKVRVIADRPTRAGCVETAFNQIRQNTGRVPAVAIRLLESVATIARCGVDEEVRLALRRQADAIRSEFKRQDTSTIDLEAIEQRYNWAVDSLEQGEHIELRSDIGG